MPYARVLNMPEFHRVLNKVPVPNMSALRIWQVCEHARIKQGAEYT